MKKTWKTTVALLLTLLMLLGALPLAAVAEAPENPYELTLNEPLEMTLPQYEDVYFRFVPETDGKYVFSFNGYDTSYAFYNSAMSQIYPDYYGPGFYSVGPLSAGETYYLRMYSYYSDIQQTVCVKTLDGFVASLDAAATAISPNDLIDVSLTYNKYQYFKFVPADREAYTFYGADGLCNLGWYFFNADLYNASSDSNNDKLNTNSYLTVGETYYLAVTTWNGESAGKLGLKTTSAYITDVFDPTTTALTLDTPIQVDVTGNQPYYFKFTAPAAGRYVFWYDDKNNSSYGMYDAQMDYKSFDGNPGYLAVTLTAGETVYVRIQYWSNYTDVNFGMTSAANYTATVLDPQVTATLVLDEATEVTAPRTGQNYVKFTPAETGNYIFLAENEMSDISGYLYSDGLAGLGGSSGEAFYFSAHLEGGKPCYLRLSTWNDTEETFDLTVKEKSAYVDSLAQELTMGTPLAVTTNPNRSVFVKFTPDETGPYMFYGDNTRGVSCSLYDSAMDSHNYNGGSGNKLELSATLDAEETYYLEIFYWYGSEPETFNLNVMPAETYFDSVALPLAIGETVSVTLQPNTGYTYYKIVPEETVKVIYYADPIPNLAESYLFPDASFNYNNAQYGWNKQVTLTAGKTYYYRMYTWGSEAQTFDFTLKTLAAHMAESPEITLGDTSITGEGHHYYKFTPTENGNYTLQLNGRYGRLYLYDGTVTELARREDYMGNSGVKLEYSLTAGQTYYYDVYTESGDPAVVTLTRSCDHADTVEVNETPATCTVNGYTAGVYCNDCGEWLSGHALIKASHKDADGDRICDVCGEPAIRRTFVCNEAETVTATFYLNGDLVVAGEGDMEFAPWLEEDEMEFYSMLRNVRCIDIAEGITSICDYAFPYTMVDTITIPASCGEIGENAFAFESFFAKDYYILNDTLPLSNQIELPGYTYRGEGPFPFTEYAAFRRFVTAVNSAELAVTVGGMYIEYFDQLIDMQVQDLIEDGMTEEAARDYMQQMIEEEMDYIVLELGGNYGVPGNTFEELYVNLLAMLNDALGTSYTSWHDFATIDFGDEEEFDPDFEISDGFKAIVASVFGVSLDVLDNMEFSVRGYYLGSAPGSYSPFTDVTVHANCGSTAQTAAATSRVKFDSLKHDWNEEGDVLQQATCTEPGVLQVTCKYCDATETRTIQPTGTHSWDDGVITTTATCKTDGIKTYTCTACNETRTENLGKNPQNHEGAANKTAAKNATCDAAGNIEYYTCSGCGKLFKDAARTQETNAAGVTIPKKNHAWGAWTTVRNATCTQEGLEQRVCANDSSHKETRPIAKTAHVDNGNGYCKNCGADLKGGDRCKCGEIHTGPFAWLIKFFHTIVYFFKNLGK